MLGLPVLQPGEIESPAQMFRCEFYRATIAAGICVARQKHRYRQRIGGGRGTPGRSEMRVSKHLEHCASGECAPGNVIAGRLKDFEPEDEEAARDRRRAEFTRSGQAKVAEVEQRLAAEARATVDEVAAAVGQTRSTRPAPPAEEKRMRTSKIDALSDEDVRKAFEEALSVAALRARLGGGMKQVRDRAAKLGLLRPRGSGSRRQAAPRTLDEVAKKHAGKPAADDVVSLLEERRAHHLDQAEKIGKALEALR